MIVTSTFIAQFSDVLLLKEPERRDFGISFFVFDSKYRGEINAAVTSQSVIFVKNEIKLSSFYQALDRREEI